MREKGAALENRVVVKRVSCLETLKVPTRHEEKNNLFSYKAVSAIET